MSTTNIGGQTTQRLRDLTNKLSDNGFGTIAEAIMSRPSNIRYFGRDEHSQESYRADDLRLIVETETLLNDLKVSLPRYRRNTAALREAISKVRSS